MPLEDLLTIARPFGPHDQAKIDDSKDAVELLDLYDPIAAVTRSNHTLIYGRKGSGKSAVISLYQGYRFVSKRAIDDSNRIEEVNKNTIYVPIKTWDHFFDMNQSVQRILAEKSGVRDVNALDFDLIPVETIEQAWLERIWDEIFRRFYDMYRQDEVPEPSIPNVILCFDDEKLANLRGTPEYVASTVFRAAKQDVLKFLERRNTSVCVLFDSMEKYPISSGTFGASMGGFLRSINSLQAAHVRTRAIFALPEELMPFFQSNSENLLKDFENSFAMRWSPEQLLRMAAHRYRLFTKIHDSEFYRKIKDFDFHSRSQLRDFYATLFPVFVENEMGKKESAVAYIIRHTQLLPRHFIMYLNRIAVISHGETGGWREFKPQAFNDAIQVTEELIAKEVLSPYEFIHKGIGGNLKTALAGLGPIFSFGELHKRVNRVKDRFEIDHYQFIEMLFNIGVIGRLRSESSGLYENADFYFNRQGNVAFASDELLCFHPIFSRYFSAHERRNGDERIIYPNGIEVEV